MLKSYCLCVMAYTETNTLSRDRVYSYKNNINTEKMRWDDMDSDYAPGFESRLGVS